MGFLIDRTGCRTRCGLLVIRRTTKQCKAAFPIMRLVHVAHRIMLIYRATVAIAFLINLFLLTDRPSPYVKFTSLGSLWDLSCRILSGIKCLIKSIISISKAIARHFLPALSTYKKDPKSLIISHTKPNNLKCIKVKSTRAYLSI